MSPRRKALIDRCAPRRLGAESTAPPGRAGTKGNGPTKAKDPAKQPTKPRSGAKKDPPPKPQEELEEGKDRCRAIAGDLLSAGFPRVVYDWREIVANGWDKSSPRGMGGHVRGTKRQYDKIVSLLAEWDHEDCDDLIPAPDFPPTPKVKDLPTFGPKGWPPPPRSD
jgi:hypothetical protein